jgi:hypothetical protein
MAPMPATFFSPYSINAHADTPEHLLEWFSCRPFCDRASAVLLGGKTGVACAVHFLLKILISACSVLRASNATASAPHRLRQFFVRHVLEHCCRVLKNQLAASVELLRAAEASSLRGTAPTFQEFPLPDQEVKNEGLNAKPAHVVRDATLPSLRGR